jgi:hypothetical protein
MKSTLFFSFHFSFQVAVVAALEVFEIEKMVELIFMVVLE